MVGIILSKLHSLTLIFLSLCFEMKKPHGGKVFQHKNRIQIWVHLASKLHFLCAKLFAKNTEVEVLLLKISHADENLLLIHNSTPLAFLFSITKVAYFPNVLNPSSDAYACDASAITRQHRIEKHSVLLFPAQTLPASYENNMK